MRYLHKINIILNRHKDYIIVTTHLMSLLLFPEQQHAELHTSCITHVDSWNSELYERYVNAACESALYKLLKPELCVTTGVPTGFHPVPAVSNASLTEKQT